MFTGKKQFVFLILSLIAYGATYLLAYYKPDLIVPMSTEAVAYIDSFFSVFAVGMCAGMIVKLQMRVFEAEHKLNIAQREALERSSNSKSVFFANMSHEIRTPINAIIGLNEMLLRNNPSGENREYALDLGAGRTGTGAGEWGAGRGHSGRARREAKRQMDTDKWGDWRVGWGAPSPTASGGEEGK